MGNAIQDRGLFWWWDPDTDQEDAPNSIVSGELTIDEEGLINLKLDRGLPLDKPGSLPMYEAQPYPTGRMIAGTLRESGRNVLIDSIRKTGFSWRDSALRPESFVADRCLVGDFTFSREHNVLDFECFKVGLSNIEDWLNLDSIYSTMVDHDGEEFEFSVKYKSPQFTFNMTDFDLSIKTITTNPNILPSPFPASEAKFKQEFWLDYSSHATATLSNLISDFIRLEEFFSILMGSYLRLDWPYAVHGKGSEEKWFRLYFFRGSVPKFAPGFGDALTWFMWVRDSLGELLANFKLKREQYGPGYYLYLAGLRKTDLYAEHKFVNLIWALESLHRKKSADKANPEDPRIQRILERFRTQEDKEDGKWLRGQLKHAGGPNLEDRIFDSFANLPLDLDQKALRRFATKCQARRNQISHTGGPVDGESYSDFSQDVLRLWDALSHLYKAILLHEIGLPDDKLKEAFTSTQLARGRMLPSFRIFGLVP
jgi:hypothetical protein